jgi:hypothetical protein
MACDPSGNIYVGGASTWGDYRDVFKWDGSTWSPTGMKSTDNIRTIYANAAGIYSDAREGALDYYIKKYTSGSWSKVGLYNNSNYYIFATCADNTGENVYAIGYHPNASGQYYVAKWVQGGYSEIGSFNGYAMTLAVDAAGILYVGGLMNRGYAGGQGNFYIAKWDGSTWSDLGTFNDAIFSLSCDAANNLLVAGAMTLDPSGNILSGGPTSNAGGKYYIAKYNGSGWSAVGHLSIEKYYGNWISQVRADGSGNIYATGGFTDANGNYYVAKWDGSNWTELATFNGVINAICIDPSGNVYAAGNFKDRHGRWFVAKCN